MGSFYLTCILFVIVVLGAHRASSPVSASSGSSRYIRDELLIVLGTSSSESVLRADDAEAGAARLFEVGGRPGRYRAGYSFNLDGTNIYLTMAAIFVAQALNVDLTADPGS